MNKRRILAAAMALCIVAIIAVGATLAYLTDTKNAVNTFAIGNVKIKLIEQERDGNGGLKDFKQNKKLYPIIGSAQGEKDKYGMPTAKNYVDKMVTIENTGSEKAYIRAFFAIPCGSERAAFQLRQQGCEWRCFLHRGRRVDVDPRQQVELLRDHHGRHQV